MNIPANRLDRAYQKYRKEYDAKALEVLRSGTYILGPELAAFESEFAACLNANHCIGLASGTDALWIALHLLGIGPGDEVIVQGNAFFATVLGITRCGARPVFVEPDPTHFTINPNCIEASVSPRTKAVIVTHLYGIMTPMTQISSLCKAYDLKLIEDCAQAHGARFHGQVAGTFGDAGCFSFYPTKHLGAFGDGGAIVTNDSFFAERIRVFRNYGKQDASGDYSLQGVNSRLDELQAGFLRVRLRHLEEATKEKCKLADHYLTHIYNPAVALPETHTDTENIWHQFVIRCRKRHALIEHLQNNGIETAVHYPVPPHLCTAFKHLGLQPGALPITEHLAETVLSLPSFYGMTEEEQNHVIHAINAFQG